MEIWVKSNTWIKQWSVLNSQRPKFCSSKSFNPFPVKFILHSDAAALVLLFVVLRCWHSFFENSVKKADVSLESHCTEVFRSTIYEMACFFTAAYVFLHVWHIVGCSAGVGDANSRNKFWQWWWVLIYRLWLMNNSSCGVFVQVWGPGGGGGCLELLAAEFWMSAHSSTSSAQTKPAKVKRCFPFERLF